MIDLTKPVRTRDGREVRIYAKDGGCDIVNVPPKMIKRRLYISTWGDVGWRAWGDVGWKADTGPLIKSNFGGVNLTAFNFPVDIEIPEGYGL